MPRKVLYGFLIVFLLLISAGELGYTFNNSYAVTVLVAGGATAFFVYMVRGSFSGSVMANGDKIDTAEWEGFGNKIRIPAKALAGNSLIVIAMFGVILFLQYKILESINRLIESNAETIYVLSLSQDEREKLRIVMPESLRRKIRAQ